MNSAKIFLCFDPVERRWGTGTLPLPGGCALLIGWPLRERVDAGLPQYVARCLAAAITCRSRVYFFSSAREYLARADTRRINDKTTFSKLTESDLMRNVRSFLRLRGYGEGLVSTNSRTIVEEAFSQADFAWWNQSQCILWSKSDNPDIFLSRVLAAQLLDGGWVEAARPLEEAGVLGAARPGVDGDVASLVFFERGARDCFVSILAGACKSLGVLCETISESDFMVSIAGRSAV